MQTTPTTGATRPNILWLTIEDTSAHEFPFYGNAHAKTPALEGLAARGVVFERAWACGPQCSPSRSSIITASDATTYGSEWHRRTVVIPDNIYFPLALREAGYYCTNNPKADYNSTTPPRAIWDEHGPGSSYNSPRRAPGQPFFAVFNCEATHMGRLRSFDLQGRRDFSKEGLDPARLQLPSHVPDLPAMRSDTAFHLEGVQDVDKWVAIFLNDLKAKGLEQDTIVFFYSDHGGCTPRGKGFVYETGLRVPLIAYVPPKWRHLSPFVPGTRSAQPVALLDLGPTVLSLAGVTPPAHMQGRAIMGAAQAAPRELMFGFVANQSHHFQPARVVTDGRFKLFRSYAPHKPLNLRNNYQWGMPANLAWDEAVLSGRVTKAEHLQPFRPHKAERLFDLQADPWELRDLSDDPQHRETLAKMSRALDDHARETADLGLFPAAQRNRPQGLYAWTRATNYPLAPLHEAAKTAMQGQVANLARLTGYLKSDKPEIRFWGASGFATLAAASLAGAAPQWTPPAELLDALKDPEPGVVAEAAHALVYLGRADIAMPVLIDEFARNSNGAQSALETLALTEVGRAAMQPRLPRLRRLGGDKSVPASAEVAVAVAAQGAPAGNAAESGSVDWQARSILVNLGALPIHRLYGAGEQQKSRAVNEARRALMPKP